MIKVTKARPKVIQGHIMMLHTYIPHAMSPISTSYILQFLRYNADKIFSDTQLDAMGENEIAQALNVWGKNHLNFLMPSFLLKIYQ